MNLRIGGTASNGVDYQELPGVVTIPKSSTRERVKENFGTLDVKLSAEVLAALDKAFPPPKAKQSLQML